MYDKKVIASLAWEINGKIINGNDACVTQGKIYCYRGKNEVYVIYFNRSPGCMTLSYIKTGEKFYVPMSNKLKELLDELEGTALEPKTN